LASSAHAAVECRDGAVRQRKGCFAQKFAFGGVFSKTGRTSPREVLNIFQADAIGCHIITVTNNILSKLCLIGKDLESFSLETVQVFYDDGRKIGFNPG
jgi:transaldolase